jgi:hypothetical protein
MMYQSLMWNFHN